MLKLWNKRNKVKKGSTSNKESKKESSKKDVMCHYCKQIRHFKSESPLLQKKEERKKSKKKGLLLSTWEDLENDSTPSDEEDEDEEEHVAHLCFMANREDELCLTSNKKNDVWYLNSGCSTHNTRKSSMFLQIRKYNGGYVTFGDNAKGNIVGLDEIGKSSSTSIDDVYLVDDLRENHQFGPQKD